MTDIKAIVDKIPKGLFINNEWVEAVSKKKFPVENPSTTETICEVSEADKEDVNIAVKVARKSFQTWRNVNPQERGKMLWRLADLVEKNKEELIKIESLDNGKAMKEAAIDFYLVVECMRYYAGWADKLHGKTIPTNTFAEGNETFTYTLHEPIGVVGQIIPWNFPALMFTWKISPALAAGNTIVLKTAEQTPLSALRITQLIVEAGFPPGVINVLSGYGPTAGQAISRHMDIDKVAFTGSTDIGRLIQIASGESNLKPVTLELGGKSPLVVFEDADLDKAVQIADLGLFLNVGQCCCAGSRLFVHEKVYDKFIEKAKAVVTKKVVGDPFNKDTTAGPQVDKAQFDKIMKYIESGKKQGAKLVTGGERVGDKGYFIQPTIFADVKDDMEIAKDEIFGPVLSVLKFKDMDEIIKRANKTTYGLAAGVITNDISKAFTFAHNVKAGTVWINCYDAFHASAPFGGFKQSGIGRELGKYGLRQYVQVKTVTMSLPRYRKPIEFVDKD